MIFHYDLEPVLIQHLFNGSKPHWKYFGFFKLLMNLSLSKVTSICLIDGRDKSIVLKS